MGPLSYLWSFFFKKPKSTSEQLEEIDESIISLDDKRQSNLELEKRIIGSLVFYSIVAYIVGAIVLLLYYFPTSTWPQICLFSLPLLLFPFLIIGTKRLLHRYFLSRVEQMDIELRNLRKKKSKLLDTVMEKETYKKAKEILQRFDPLRFRQIDIEQRRPQNRLSEDTQLFKRSNTPQGGNAGPPQSSVTLSFPGQPLQQTPFARPQMPPSGPGVWNGNRPGQPGPPQMGVMGPGPQGYTPRLPRPILARDRSPLDRVIDALVGDGPEKRYALVCARCSSHNGMALAEEFQYLAFRCCYCGFPNAARRIRPAAPVVGYLESTSTTPDTQSEAGSPLANQKQMSTRHPLANQGLSVDSDSTDAEDKKDANDTGDFDGHKSSASTPVENNGSFGDVDTANDSIKCGEDASNSHIENPSSINVEVNHDNKDNCDE